MRPIGQSPHQASLRIHVGDCGEQCFEHCVIAASDQGIVIVGTDQQSVEYLVRIQALLEERHGYCNKILILRYPTDVSDVVLSDRSGGAGALRIPG